MRKIILDRADRLQRMPPEATRLKRLIARTDKRAIPIIDLTIDDHSVNPSLPLPTLTTADFITPADDEAMAGFREAVVKYYYQRYQAILDPQKEVLPVAGLTAGLHLLTLALVDPGEMVLVPDPGAPLYRSAAALCSGGVQLYYLYDRYNYIPDCRMIANNLVGKTKLWILGYPHDPTGAVTDRDFYTEAIRLARRHNILLVHDGRYSLLSESDTGDAGFLAQGRATGTGIELISFAHNFGFGDLPLAALIGNKEALAAVGFLSRTLQINPSRGVLTLGCWSLEHAEQLLSWRRQWIAQSQTILTTALERLKWGVRANKDLPFCWVTLPRRYSSLGFCRRLLRRTGIKATPGTTYGEQGEGYARFSLISDPQKMKSAADLLIDFVARWSKRGRKTAKNE